MINICKACGGSSICEHDKRRSICKDCGGSSICEHNKQKHDCKDCGGSSICEHHKYRRLCKDCGGTSICIHGKVRNICKDCGGTSICEHGKRRSRCKDCGGSSICEHSRERYQCRDCGGSSICEHNLYKSLCKDCGGSSLCKTEHCTTRSSNPKYLGYCMFCFIHIHPELPVTRNYKTKETETVSKIITRFPGFSWVINKRIEDGCFNRKPDLQLDMGTHVIIVEIDENKHSGYDCSCEHKRLMELSLNVCHRPIVFIRFNPDAYRKVDGSLVHSCWKLNKLGICVISEKKKEEWKLRMESLFDQIQNWIDFPTEKTIEIVELFY